MSKNYSREQNALFKKMQDCACRVMFAVNAVNPTGRVLNNRLRAAMKLSDLATLLEQCIEAQLGDKRKVK